MNANLFVALVLAVAAGYIVATYCSGFRHREPTAQNLRQSLMVAVAIAVFSACP